MSKEDIGKMGLTLMMDTERTLRWTFKAMQKFEDRARGILKKMDILAEGKPVYKMPLTTGFLLANYLRIADILEAAVGAAIDNSNAAGDAIQGYLDNSGSLEELQNAVYEAYLVTNDPSTVSTWKGNLQAEQEDRRITQEIRDTQLKIKAAQLERTKKELSDLTTTNASGGAPPG